jgi:transcriptional regulator with XRE-family HTH domain
MARQLPDRWHDLGAFIREQRSSARLSLRRLSELAGISNPYLSQIERGLRKPSAEILQQIAKALRISAETLYVQAGILEPGSGEHDLAREILADPHLTEDQKQALVRIYLSFRHEHEDEEAAAAAAADATAPADETANGTATAEDGQGTAGRQPGPTGQGAGPRAGTEPAAAGAAGDA